VPQPSSSSPGRLASRVLAGATDIRKGEGRAVLACGLLFFLVLAAVMVLRPVREAMGLQKGIENVRSLFLYTVGVTLLLVPGFGYLVSRVRRRVFLAVSFRGCALMLLGFYLCLTSFPEPVGRVAAQLYYVYHSVFNLLVVSIFWAFMADLFSVGESKRLFPAIAVGGTLGAITGSTVSWAIPRLISQAVPGRTGTALLFLVAVVLLEAAVWAAVLVARTRSATAAEPTEARLIGGRALAGITSLLHSPYLLGIASLILLSAVVSTFFYFTGLRIVEAATSSVGERTVLFAEIDFWTQLGTLLAQAFLAGRIMRWLGVGTALAALPLVSAIDFGVLAVAPISTLSVLTVYVVVNTTYRAVERGITVPARETLFTVLEPAEKYKAKSLLDTVGYRAGDASGAQLERWLAGLGGGLNALALAVLPLALGWAALSLLLGRAQSRLADRRPRGSA
jgi:AAA family ATP:ADP antiporter